MENTKELESDQIKKNSWTEDEVEEIKSILENKFLRLYADFENYKKRVSKEKEELVIQTKSSLLNPILDLENELTLAKKSTNEEGVILIWEKFQKFLTDNNIEVVQTDVYDPYLHDVISVLETGEEKILDVVSRGYKIDNKIIRYPKVILGK